MVKGTETEAKQKFYFDYFYKENIVYKGPRWLCCYTVKQFSVSLLLERSVRDSI